MRVLLFSVIFLFSVPLFSQSSFRKLSRPEKFWVLFHPIKARKAQKVTRSVMKVVDSVKRTGIIGADGNGGRLDAFRHAFWMASLTREIGRRAAHKLGIAHEKGNYLQFRKAELEDGALPDSVSCEMDLKNNEKGIKSVTSHSGPAYSNVLDQTLKMVKDGDLFIIRKNQNGDYLDCGGNLIDMGKWKGKWAIPKCLISSKE